MRYLMPFVAVAIAGPLCAQPHTQGLLITTDNSISQEIQHLRDVPDSQRGGVTKHLALEIRQLPQEERLGLALPLANLATEGDYGRETLQEVATTLATALRDTPPAGPSAPMAYSELAQLVRYEHVDASLDVPGFRTALAKLEADDRRRDDPDFNFTLSDLDGHPWTLKDLRGKVVLVNFWATWCPPCRKEMPDLEALYNRFKDKGLIVLAISDEDASKVAPFIAEHHYTYPILLDPGSKVHQLFVVQGIPKSFLYNREGHLAAEAIDMRTMNQFLALLDQAGMQ